jgi:hypothetical protein
MDKFKLFKELSSSNPRLIPEYRTSENYTFKILPEYDPNWKCYLFGATPNTGLVYVPIKGQVPNFIVRWLMYKLLACRWVKQND